MMNSSGPSMLPWGTPTEIGLGDERQFPIETTCSREER